MQILKKSGLVWSVFAIVFMSHFASTQSFADLTVPDILDAKALKSEVSPCQDFYQFACGSWLDQTQIPSDKNSVYHQSTALMDQSDQKLNAIIEPYSRGDYSRVPTKYASKLGDFYSSCMTYENRHSQKRALAIISHYRRAIDQVASTSELAKLVAELHLIGVNVLFGFGSGQDFNDSSKVIGFASQGGMGLPDRDYYFKKDPKSLDIINKYAGHISSMFQLAGAPKLAAQDAARFALNFESNLAEKAMGLDDRNNPELTNHPMAIADLKKLAPAFDWDAYFGVLGIGAEATINVMEPDFYANLSRMLTKWADVKNPATMAMFKKYLKWQLLLGTAASATPAFDQETFMFWKKFLKGQKAPLPKWKECTQEVESSLDYALAEAYVKTFEGGAIKKRVNAMIVDVKASFANDLDRLAQGDGWLDKVTKDAALEKLNLLAQKLGAPEKWRNYDELKTSRSSFLYNQLSVARFNHRRDLAKIGKPVDKSEWYMMPWEINAYYDPSNNEFVFPFGILQPPSFDLNASDGANLGAFGGGTIGHELTHGFDKDGSQFDGHGNIKDWWSAETKKLFAERTQCYVDQADHYNIKVGTDSLSVNGKNTITENVADQGGVKLGYLALEELLRSRPQATPWLGKYSERQQYWIAYAQSWCTKRTPESLRHLISTNEHPPEEFRVNGVVMNRPEFAADFGCKAGDPMAPAKSCSVW